MTADTIIYCLSSIRIIRHHCLGVVGCSCSYRLIAGSSGKYSMKNLESSNWLIFSERHLLPQCKYKYTDANTGY